MNVACRGKRVGALLFGIATSVCHSVRPIADSLLARLLHGWKLKLLVVEVVRFFATVALSVARKLFIQMNS